MKTTIELTSVLSHRDATSPCAAPCDVPLPTVRQPICKMASEGSSGRARFLQVVTWGIPALSYCLDRNSLNHCLATSPPFP